MTEEPPGRRTPCPTCGLILFVANSEYGCGTVTCQWRKADGTACGTTFCVGCGKDKNKYQHDGTKCQSLPSIKSAADVEVMSIPQTTCNDVNVASGSGTILQFFVYTNQYFTVRMNPNQTLNDLYAVIRERTGWSDDMIQLKYAGKALQKGPMTLVALGVQSGQTFNAAPRLRGGHP
jgi:hypothetical protein